MKRNVQEIKMAPINAQNACHIFPSKLAKTEGNQ